MARKYNNGSPETAETRDIPKDTLAAVNRRLAMSCSDFRLDQVPATSPSTKSARASPKPERMPAI